MRRSVWSPWAAAMHTCLQGQRNIKGGQTPVSTSQGNQWSGWNHFRQVRWNGQKTQLGTALQQTGGELGPAHGMLSEIKTFLSGLSGCTMKTWRGRRFLSVENWCGDTVTSCHSCHRTHHLYFLCCLFDRFCFLPPFVQKLELCGCAIHINVSVSAP